MALTAFFLVTWELSFLHHNTGALREGEREGRRRGRRRGREEGGRGGKGGRRKGREGGRGGKKGEREGGRERGRSNGQPLMLLLTHSLRTTWHSTVTRAGVPITNENTPFWSLSSVLLTASIITQPSGHLCPSLRVYTCPST